MIEPSPSLERYHSRDYCPLCGGAADEARHEIAASEPRAEDLDPNLLGRFLSDYDSRRVFFTYLECPSCSGCFCPVYFSQPQLNALYASQPENMELAPLAARERTQASYLSILRRHADMVGTFLEIGADIGLFAEQCAQAGQFNRFVLYEPNETTHGAIMQRMGTREVSIRTENFSSGDVEPGSVSVAVLIHVLDHILEPDELLSRILESLRPGGTLFVVTHNRASMLARVLGRRWPPYTMQHPHLFTPETMNTLLSRVGFERVSTHKTFNSFPAAYFVKAGLSTVGLDAIPIPSWSRPLLSIPLGNIATVAHRPG